MTAPAVQPLSTIDVAAGAWHGASAALAEFAMTHLVNRTDACGAYFPNGQPTTDKNGLSIDTLLAHFRGERTIGVHAIGLDQLARWAAWDFDQHDDQNAPLAEENLADAEDLARRLRELGAVPLLEDSNGKGGVHVWVRFDRPTLARNVRAWAKGLVADGVEVFPKQDGVKTEPGPGHYGSYIRLPGKHHKRDHWSRFIDADAWLDGDDAIDLLLRWDATSAGVVPEAPPKPVRPLPSRVAMADSTRGVRWARAALEDEVQTVVDAVDLRRNITLNTAAFNLGRKIGGGYLDRGEVERALFAAAEANGDAVDDPAQARRTIQSGIEAGILDPQHPPPRAPQAPPPPHDPSMTGDDGPRQGFNLTDAGNGERFAARNRDALRYDAAAGLWRYYDGKRWDADRIGRAINLAKQTVRAMYAEASSSNDGGIRKALAEHAVRCETRDRLKAMADLARTEPGMTIVAEKWDADPWALNVANGTLDLRTGQLRQHRADDLITKLSPTGYDPTATCPRFMSFLAEIFAGDPTLIGYVQALIGYAACEKRTEHVLPVFYGSGANGKSTLLDLVCHVLGDYADQGAPDLLTERKGSDEHPTEIADLKGKRFVVCSETERNRRLRVQLVKRLTGDAMLKGRYMRQDYFSFPRSFLPVLVTNNKPKVEEDSEGIWRRVRLVPFSVVIPAGQRDGALLDKLKAEAPGVLRWIVDGCRRWQREGLTEPPAVLAATQEYRVESDPLGPFIGECCVVRSGAWALTSTLRKAYETFCGEQGTAPVEGREFTDALRRHGFKASRRHEGRCWLGIDTNTDQDGQNP